MTGFTAALWTETLKLRRSKVPLVSVAGFALIPLMGGLFMLIVKDPQLASRLGMLTTKAQLSIGSADWPAYFKFLTQALAAGGMILFGLLITWIFGREYSDRTAKDLLALPTSRGAIVLAKFVVVTCWSVLLALLVFVLSIGVGNALALPGWSAAFVQHTAGVLTLVVGLSLVLVLPFAVAASVGRGYLPAFGCMLLAVILSETAATIGWGPYFPWAIAGLAGVNGPETLGLGSYALVVLTGAAGVIGTLAWWRYADQT